MRKILFLINPSSGNRKSLKNLPLLKSLIKKYHLNGDIAITESPDHLIEILHKRAHLYQTIAGMGGDSTIAIIVNELVKKNIKVPLAIIPSGSSDDIAAHYNIYNIETAMKTIEKNNIKEIDVAFIKNKNGEYTHFIGQANMGIGAYVNSFVEKYKKKYRFAYKWQSFFGFAAIASFFITRKPALDFSIEHHEEKYKISGTSFLFTKIKLWASGKIYAPDAIENDGNIHAVFISKCSFFQFINLYFKATSGRHIHLPYVKSLSAPWFNIKAKTPFMLQVDGDILYTDNQIQYFQELTIGISRNKLSLLIP